MDRLAESVDQIAASTGFSGVVRVDRDDDSSFASAYGLAHRGHRIANTVNTRFGIASGTKGMTALTVMALVERGELELATTARSVLGHDLPLIDDSVNVEHLLAHRSGIGDYLDEEAVGAPTDYVMPVPVHLLARTEEYVRVLAGHPQAFAPGERFSYNNSGFVVLALIAERVSGTPFTGWFRSLCVGRPACATQRSCAQTNRPGVPLLGISMPAGSGPTCCICRS
jgi:CubicO group peptidase (beta-lactamase class C family)